MEKNKSKVKPKRAYSTTYRNAKKMMRNSMGAISDVLDDLEALVRENYEFGNHLHEEVFIPEYLGFTDNIVDYDQTGIFRYYQRGEDVVLMRDTQNDENWFLQLAGKELIQIKLPNTYIAITVLQSLGIDIDINRYMDGVWLDGIKNIKL
jgi:hypothetical protein